jgi:hypothetical protein
MAKLLSDKDIVCRRTTGCRGTDRVRRYACGCRRETNENPHSPECLASMRVNSRGNRSCGQPGEPETHTARRRARRCACRH